VGVNTFGRTARPRWGDAKDARAVPVRRTPSPDAPASPSLKKAVDVGALLGRQSHEITTFLGPSRFDCDIAYG
jgi:hypothetical protein